MQQRKIICLGNINLDLVMSVPRLPAEHEKLQAEHSYIGYGGAAANTAYWLGLLGLEPMMWGTVGADSAGKDALAALEAAGVDVTAVGSSTASATGVAVCLVSSESKRMIVGAGANAATAAPPPHLFAGSAHLHVAARDDRLALAALRAAKAGGASTSCDFNGRVSLERARYCDLCMMNSDELRALLPEADPRSAWRSAFPQTMLAVTDGKAGAWLIGGEGERLIPARSREVVDRTGAGDAFNAGFLYGQLNGWSAERSAALGLELAGEVLGWFGARPAEVTGARCRALRDALI